MEAVYRELLCSLHTMLSMRQEVLHQAYYKMKIDVRNSSYDSPSIEPKTLHTRYNHDHVVIKHTKPLTPSLYFYPAILGLVKVKLGKV
jgi:hypothetical protein